jgi:hypothetical protein
MAWGDSVNPTIADGVGRCNPAMGLVGQAGVSWGCPTRTMLGQRGRTSMGAPTRPSPNPTTQSGARSRAARARRRAARWWGTGTHNRAELWIDAIAVRSARRGAREMDSPDATACDRPDRCKGVALLGSRGSAARVGGVTSWRSLSAQVIVIRQRDGELAAELERRAARTLAPG